MATREDSSPQPRIPFDGTAFVEVFDYPDGPLAGNAGWVEDLGVGPSLDVVSDRCVMVGVGTYYDETVVAALDPTQPLLLVFNPMQVDIPVENTDMVCGVFIGIASGTRWGVLFNTISGGNVDPRPQCVLLNTDGSESFNVRVPLVKNAPRVVAASFDGTTATVTVDGVVVGSAAILLPGTVTPGMISVLMDTPDDPNTEVSEISLSYNLP